MIAARIIQNTHMGLGHTGLAEAAKKFKLNVGKLDGDEVIIFINRAQDKLKMLGAKGVVLGYLRLPEGKLSLDAIQYIPKTFGANAKIDYDGALKQALTKLLEKRAKRGSPMGVL